MNELSIFVFMGLGTILWSAFSYSIGYKEGQRIGFTRGRAVSRHMAGSYKADIK